MNPPSGNNASRICVIVKLCIDNLNPLEKDSKVFNACTLNPSRVYTAVAVFPYSLCTDQVNLTFKVRPKHGLKITLTPNKQDEGHWRERFRDVSVEATSS